MGKMISISEVSELTGVTIKTLKIWDNEGKLKAKYKTAGGHRRYDLDDIEMTTNIYIPIQNSPMRETIVVYPDSYSFILLSDEWSVKIIEYEFGIIPKPTDTLESRKQRIIASKIS